MKRPLKHMLLLLAMLITIAANARQPFSKDIWLNETNVPVKVNCLTKGYYGYIWIGTDEGLYNYNGRSFVKIETHRDEPVTALAIDGDKVVAGFAKGAIGVWDGENFRLKKMSGQVPGEAISSIHIIAENIFLLATLGEGLYLCDRNYCTRYTMENGLTDDYIYTTVSPAKDLLLAGTDQGINEVKISKGKFTVHNYTTSSGLPDNIVSVIKPMQKKCWSWIGTHQGGIALYCSKTRTVWTPQGDKPWRWGQINDILPIGDDNAWVCTEDGYLLNIRLTGEGKLITTEHYYEGQKLYKLLMDETGNIWCATNAGLKQIVSEYMTSVHLPAPYSLQELTALICDYDTELWFAQKNTLYSFSLLEEHPVPKKRYVSNTPITELYCDKNDVLWIGTFGDGLWYSADHRNFSKVKGIAPLEEESILDIAGSGRQIWVAGLNGVEELEIGPDNSLLLKRLHNKNTGIGSDYVYKIFPDSKNNIWMATDGAGVCRYKNGSYTLWDTVAGMNSKVTYNITEDKDGNIWASSFDNGLLVYNGKKWHNLNRDNGLQSLKIATIISTGNGNMLVVHARGIDEWHKNSRMFRHYGRRQGINMDTVSATLNLAATDTTGNVYIPYQDGLICFGKYNYTTTITPKIHIKSLNTFFRKIHRDRNSFKHAENHITFEFDGINFANPEQLFYRYKLEGYNDDWIPTRDEAITFPQLPSGSYRFVVQVSMNNLFSSYGEAAHSFEIAKPFWQELWFILLMAGVIWAIGYTYIRIRESNLRKLSSLQRERMMFEYEHLKSQVNPHFLFNSLNTLTGLIEENKQGAMQYTTQLSDLYRNMLSHKDKDLITLGEEWEILDNYIYIQKSRFGDALNLVVNISEKLKKTKKVVPMALQLLLENAIKHNIVSQSKPLTITFDASEDQLTVSNTYQPKMSKEKGAGLGLANIRKRYALHTKKLVTSSIEHNEFIVTIPLI